MKNIAILSLLFLVLAVSVSAQTVTVNFSQNVGTVKSDFYCVNVHQALKTSARIDTNGDGVNDAASNWTWLRQAVLDSGSRCIRTDAGLTNKWVLSNPDFEQWSNTSAFIVTNNDVVNIPYFWRTRVDGAATNGTISRTTFAMNGTYAANVTMSGGGIVSIYRSVNLRAGHVYNLSVYARAGGTCTGCGLQINILRTTDAVAMCNYYQWPVSYVDGWVKYSCQTNNTAITNESAGAYQLWLKTNTGSILWDNVSITEDGVPYTYWTTNWTTDALNVTQWAYNNNVTIAANAIFMPDYLANVTSDCIGNTQTCLPNDYAAWANLNIEYINLTTSNGAYPALTRLDDFNEPELQPELLINQTNRTSAVVLKGINSLWTALNTSVPTAYPFVSVGGPVIGHDLYDVAEQGIMHSFCGNFSKNGYFSFHKYHWTGQPEYDTHILAGMTDILTHCSFNQFFVGEINENNATNNVNNTGEAKKQVALAYAAMLNTYPANTTMALYQLSEFTNYSSGSGKYPSWPNRYTMVAEPALENTYYWPFNLTKDFSTYFGPGRNISSFASDNSGVYGVASANATTKYLSLINKNTTTWNVSVNLSGLSGVVMRDAKTLAIQPYSTATSTFTASIVNSSVNYYEILSAAPPTIALSGPVNASINTSSTLSFTFTPTEQYGVTTCSLIVNGSSYATTNATNATVNNITVTSINSSSILYQNPLNWSINCSDNAGNVNSSATSQVYTALYISGTGNVVSILNNVSYAATVPFNLSTNGIIPSSPTLTLLNGTVQNLSFSYDNVSGFANFTTTLPTGTTNVTWDSNAPVVNNIIISYNNLFPSGILSGLVNASSVGGENLSLNYTWYLNGLPYSNGIINQSSALLVNPSNISGVFSTGQNWSFGVIASNGFVSVAANATQVTIADPGIPGGSGSSPGSGGGASCPVGYVVTMVNGFASCVSNACPTGYSVSAVSGAPVCVAGNLSNNLSSVFVPVTNATVAASTTADAFGGTGDNTLIAAVIVLAVVGYLFFVKKQ